MTTAEIAVADPADTLPALVPVNPFDALMRYRQVLESAKEFAEYICMTPMVPPIYQGKPKHATVAIMHGAELGLNPLQSLQQIFTVHGMPAIYARTMVALLKNRGFRFRTVETGPERVTITGTSPDGVETETSTWTIQRAAEAGYIPTIDENTGQYKKNANGKIIGNEKYLTEPENMLWAKAAAEVSRRLAPDVLLGIARTVEDLESEPVFVESERVSPAEALAAATAPAVPVKQWTPPAESSGAVEKQDTPQASEPEPPVTAQGGPAEPAMTKIQQRKVGRLFAERGISGEAAILWAIGSFLGREVTSAADVTRDEAIRLLEHLEADPPATKAQTERLDALLSDIGLVDADRWEFCSLKFDRQITTLAHLTSSEADVLATDIENTIAGPAQTDDATAGGAE